MIYILRHSGDMTFEQFQQTRVDVDDLRLVETARDYFEDSNSEVAGAVYAGGLWVERCGAMWIVTLANKQLESYSLVELESALYDYGQREGLF